MKHFFYSGLIKAGAVSVLLSQGVSQAQDYPFPLPDKVTASISIDSSQQERFNNKLLATNVFGFTSDTQQDFIHTFAPKTVRFPHGLWANWYDWRDDYTRLFGGEKVTFTNSEGKTITRKIDHLSSIQIFERLKQKIGIDGLTELNAQRLAAQGKGYDMVWTFNMSADGEHDSNVDNGSPETIARYQDILSRGFEVKDIELGNENFYPGQRSTIIPGVDDYIARAKVMSKDLKAQNPNLKLSVPMLRKANSANPHYNALVAADSSYFDAVTVHTYVGHDPDNADDSDEAFGTALVARAHIANSVNNYSKLVAPDKPVWLTEWGVRSGEANAASVMGMADVYMFMSENQDTYQRANWFSVNGKLNSFLLWETYIAPSGVERPRIKYPLEKTLFGSAYQVVQQALEDSVMLASEIASPELDLGVKAITARALIKNDEALLLVINKTNQPAPFDITIDGQQYNGGYEHKVLAFDALSEERLMAIDADPLITLNKNSGEVNLPKYSISIIKLNDAAVSEDLIELSLDTVTHEYNFTTSDAVPLIATPTVNQAEIASVAFQIQGQESVVVAEAPYEYAWRPQRSGRHTITATVTDTNGRATTSQEVYVNVEGEAQVISATVSASNTSEITLGESLTVDANVNVNVGSVDKVELYIDDVLATTLTQAPYQYVWTPTQVKTSSLYVKATSDALLSTTSEAIQVVVKQAQTPNPGNNNPPPTNPSSSSSGGGAINYWGLLLLMLLVSRAMRRRYNG